MPEYYSRSVVLMACGTLCGVVGCAAAIVLGGRLLCKIRWPRPAVRPMIVAMAAPSCTVARSLAPATWTSFTVADHLEDWIFDSILLASIDTLLAAFFLNVVHTACFGWRRVMMVLSMFAVGSLAVSRVSPLLFRLSYPFDTPSVLHILFHIALDLVGALFLRWSYAARPDNKSEKQIGPSVPPAGTTLRPWQRHPRRAPQGDRLSTSAGIDLGIHHAALRIVSSRQFVKVAPFVAALHCSTRLRPGSFSQITHAFPFLNIGVISNSTLDSSVRLVAVAAVYALRWVVSNVLVVTLFFILVSNLRWPTFNLVPLRRLSRSIRRISAQAHQSSSEPRTGANRAEGDVLPPPSVERRELTDGHGVEKSAPLVVESSNRSRSPTVATQSPPRDPTSLIQGILPETSQTESHQQSVQEPVPVVETQCNIPSSTNGPYWHNLDAISKKQNPPGSGWRRRRVRMRSSLGTILTAFSFKNRDHVSPFTDTGSASSSQVDPVDVPTTVTSWDPVVDEHGASPKPPLRTVPNDGAERTPQIVDRAPIHVAEPEVAPVMSISTTDAIKPSTPREARNSVFLEQLGTCPQTPIREVTSAELPSPSEQDSELIDRPNSRWLLPPLTSRSLTAPTTSTSPPVAERLTRAASMEAMHQITRSLLSTPRPSRPDNNNSGCFSSIASRIGVPSQDSPVTPTLSSRSTSASSPTSLLASPTSPAPPRTPEAPVSSVPVSSSSPISRSHSSQPYSTPQRVISVSKRLHRQVKDIVVPNSRDSVHSSSELSFHCAGDSEVLEIMVTTTRTQVNEQDEQVRSPTSELTADGGAQVAESSQTPSEKTRGGVVARTRTLIRKKTQWWSNPTSPTRMLSRNIFHKAITSPLARRKKHPTPVNPSQLDLFSPRAQSLQTPNETTALALGSPISDSFWQPEQRSHSEPPSLREPSRPKPSRARIAEERPSLFLLSLEDHQASPDTPELVDLWKDVMEWKRSYHGHGDSCEELRTDGSSFPSVCDQYPEFPQVPSGGLRSASTTV